jgi:hypothetical protein
MAAPAIVKTNAEDIWRTLEKAAWVPERDSAVKPSGKVLYAVAFRSCPTCAAFRAAELPLLMKAGVEVRWIVYARPDEDGRVRSKPGERAMVAALWRDRDPKLLADWWAAEDLNAYYARTDLPPSPDNDPKAQALLARAVDTVYSLSDLLAPNQVEMAIPALFWRENGVPKVYIGHDSKGFAPARAFLTGSKN